MLIFLSIDNNHQPSATSLEIWIFMSTYVQVVKYIEDKFLVKKPDKKKKKKGHGIKNWMVISLNKQKE